MASEIVLAARRSSMALLLALLAALVVERWVLLAAAKTEEAYVTLLYGDEFVLGVRVLGKSIRDTGSDKDMVVLVSDGVSEYAQRLLQADGWIVEHISLLANPNQVRPKRFWGVYTKLKIFNMTDYKKVVYLDADTIVIKNIEDLFKCGEFCANLKHSERLNSGVLVVQPSEEVFKDMMTQVNSLPSYTGGDQGFLNSYYVGFANAHIFEPDAAAVNPLPKMQRLSTLYNADVGLYMLANKWMVDEKELRVIHYTLGPLKPWDWWTAWLLKPVDVWQNARINLEESLPGTAGGSIPNQQLLVKLLFVLPLCIFAYMYYKSYIQINSSLRACRNCLCDSAKRIYHKFRCGGGLPAYSSVSVAATSIANSSQQFSNAASPKLPAYLGVVSVLACFMEAAISLAIAFFIIPHRVLPWTGLLLMYEWTFTIYFLVFGGYIHLIFLWGKSASHASFSCMDTSDYDSEKGRERHASNLDVGSWFYGLGMAILAIIAPSLPCLFGITALFARLGLMVGGGLVLASFMTYASEHLAIRAFVRGYEDRDLPRSRGICLIC